MGRLVIRPMTPREVRRHLDQFDCPLRAYVCKVGRKIVGFGGLIWRWNRCDIFLDVLRPDLVPVVAMVRWARRMLRMARQMGDEAVYCLRDEHPHSARLLRLVGMTHYAMQEITFNDGTVSVRELWIGG